MSLAIALVLRYPAAVSSLGLGPLRIVAGICPSFRATPIHPVDIIREI
jgi:hypothetical protein